MSNPFLVTRPRYDDCTEYLSYYASLVLEEAKSQNIPAKDIKDEQVTKAEVCKFLSKKNPKLIFFNGHGTETALYGNFDQLLFSSDEDLTLLRNKIIYARACSAGSIFGKTVVSGNSGCFIGYDRPFCFLSDQNWSAQPAKDPIARLYLEPSNEVVLALLHGKSASDAHNRSKSAMIKNMKKVLLMEKNREPGAMQMLQYLWGNFDGQVIRGDSSARFA